MELFESWELYRKFEKEIRTENRYFLNSRYTRLFDLILDNPSNLTKISPGNILFRARKNDLDMTFTKISELGINRTSPGLNRASPYGIPYLYLAENVETAISEVRANVHQHVTVASFKAQRELSVVTISNESTYGNCPTKEFSSMEISAFIACLGLSFATPVQMKAELEYLPCQYFAEYCKKKGLDGIRYISAAQGLGTKESENKYNIVLFDDSDIEYVEAYEYYVQKIEYSITKTKALDLK